MRKTLSELSDAYCALIEHHKMSGRMASLRQQKTTQHKVFVFTTVLGCVRLTFDRLRCACVASTLRVYLWLGWLEVLTGCSGGQPTNWTRS